MKESRIKFAEKSLQKSHSFKDPFIRFIVLWIGLNSLYYTDKYGFERQRIKWYFRNKEDLVFEFLRKNKRGLESIAQFINDTHQHVKLGEFLRTRRSFLRLINKKSSVKDFTEFLYQIRNNMFHAVKEWDEKDEAKLLSMVGPILEKLLTELIRSETRT